MTAEVMSNVASPKPKKVVRTAAGLRDAIFDEWDCLRSGESNPQRAIAVARLACQVINSVKAEIEFHSHVRSFSAQEDAYDNGPLVKTLRLGEGKDK